MFSGRSIQFLTGGVVAAKICAHRSSPLTDARAFHQAERTYQFPIRTAEGPSIEEGKALLAAAAPDLLPPDN